MNIRHCCRADVRVGDANAILGAWCRERDWQRERAVVFLDPYGMQVDWSTVEALAATKAIDLWYLFPLPARLLTHDGDIPELWKKRLDALFGTSEWSAEFYRTQSAQTVMFGQGSEVVERDASVAKIGGVIHRRLNATFVKAAEGKVLRNSRRSPLFLLCFAAANEKGAPTAIRIAQHILTDD